MELPRLLQRGSPNSSSSLIAVASSCGCYFFVFFLLLASRRHCALAGAGGASDPPLTPILRDLYRSSDALLEEVRALVNRHPDKLAVDSMEAGDNGYSAEILVVTYNRAKFDLDSNSTFRVLLMPFVAHLTGLERTFPVFQSFGQHGRELITSELALQLLYILSEENTMLGMDPISLNHILDNIVIKVVPMENINGRKLVESGELCERRNGRGVDLNRNWSVDWGKKEKDFDPYEENPGTAPFSEPEAQMMQKLAKSFNPHVWVNVHSGMEALFMPYDHKNATPDGFMSHTMQSILQELNQHHCLGRCLVGSGGGSVGYLAHGTSTDYMYDILKVPLAFTFEIYGDSEASPKDCVKMFNPIDITTFSRVINDWCAAFLLIFEIGPRQLDKAQVHILANSDKWISIDKNSIEGRMKEISGGIRKMEGLELGLQELRTYFRLFMLSSVLLMFMFCSRISKSKFRQTKSSIPL